MFNLEERSEIKISSVAVEGHGNLYFGDASSKMIFKFFPNGILFVQNDIVEYKSNISLYFINMKPHILDRLAPGKVTIFTPPVL